MYLGSTWRIPQHVVGPNEQLVELTFRHFIAFNAGDKSLNLFLLKSPKGKKIKKKKNKEKDERNATCNFDRY